MKDSLCCILGNLFSAIGNQRFLAYILVGVIVLGGLGIWLPAIVPSGGWVDLATPSNHLTYSFAILITLCVEALLVYNKSDNDDNFGLGLIFGTIAIFCSLLGYSKNIPELSIIGTILAIIIHATATANNKRFKKEPCSKQPISSATGFKKADEKMLDNKEEPE